MSGNTIGECPVTGVQRRALAHMRKEEGNKEFKKENYELAIEKYSIAIQMLPDQSLFYLNRGKSFMKIGLFEDCRKDCDACLVLDEEMMKSIWTKAKSYQEEGDRINVVDCSYNKFTTGSATVNSITAITSSISKFNGINSKIQKHEKGLEVIRNWLKEGNGRRKDNENKPLIVLENELRGIIHRLKSLDNGGNTVDSNIDGSQKSLDKGWNSGFLDSKTNKNIKNKPLISERELEENKRKNDEEMKKIREKVYEKQAGNTFETEEDRSRAINRMINEENFGINESVGGAVAQVKKEYESATGREIGDMGLEKGSLNGKKEDSAPISTVIEDPNVIRLPPKLVKAEGNSSNENKFDHVTDTSVVKSVAEISEELGSDVDDKFSKLGKDQQKMMYDLLNDFSKQVEGVVDNQKKGVKEVKIMEERIEKENERKKRIEGKRKELLEGINKGKNSCGETVDGSVKESVSNLIRSGFLKGKKGLFGDNDTDTACNKKKSLPDINSLPDKDEKKAAKDFGNQMAKAFKGFSEKRTNLAKDEKKNLEKMKMITPHRARNREEFLQLEKIVSERKRIKNECREHIVKGMPGNITTVKQEAIHRLEGMEREEAIKKEKEIRKKRDEEIGKNEGESKEDLELLAEVRRKRAENLYGTEAKKRMERIEKYQKEGGNSDKKDESDSKDTKADEPSISSSSGSSSSSSTNKIDSKEGANGESTTGVGATVSGKAIEESLTSASSSSSKTDNAPPESETVTDSDKIVDVDKICTESSKEAIARSKAKASKAFGVYSREQEEELILTEKGGHKYMPDKPTDIILPSDYQKKIGEVDADMLFKLGGNHGNQEGSIDLNKKEVVDSDTVTGTVTSDGNAVTNAGKKPSPRLLLSVFGDIFDVSDRPDKYGPNGPYEGFAGRDITFGLETGNDDPKTCTNQFFDLFKSEDPSLSVLAITGWIVHYEKEYGEPVGRLREYRDEGYWLEPPPKVEKPECSIM